MNGNVAISMRVNSMDDVSTLLRNLVNFGPVTAGMTGLICILVYF